MVTTRENIDRVIAACRRATEANTTCKARRGSVVKLDVDNCDDVMITADLHGQRRNFERLLAIAALEDHPRRHLIMQEVCHGGPHYPSGTGDMSHTMLEDVAQLKAQFPERLHFIASNHELAEATDYPIVKAGKMLNLIFRCGMMEMYGDAVDEVRAAYQEFIRSCPLGVRVSGNVFVCHSAPERVDTNGFDRSIFDMEPKDIPLEENGSIFKLVWGRDYREDNAEAFARLMRAEVFIHGHEPCPQGFQVPNGRQVIIDGCGQKATYVILPTGRQLTQREIVERIRPVWEE